MKRKSNPESVRSDKSARTTMTFAFCPFCIRGMSYDPDSKVAGCHICKYSWHARQLNNALKCGEDIARWGYYYPRAAGDRKKHYFGVEPALIWLALAAMAGIAGNAAYDGLRLVVRRLRRKRCLSHRSSVGIKVLYMTMHICQLAQVEVLCYQLKTFNARYAVKVFPKFPDEIHSSPNELPSVYVKGLLSEWFSAIDFAKRDILKMLPDRLRTAFLADYFHSRRAFDRWAYLAEFSRSDLRLVEETEKHIESLLRDVSCVKSARKKKIVLDKACSLVQVRDRLVESMISTYSIQASALIQSISHKSCLRDLAEQLGLKSP